MGEFRTTTGEPMPKARSERRRSMMRRGLWTAGVLAVAVTAGVFVRVDRRFTATGYVTTEDYAEVRSPVAGTVAEIAMQSGSVVTQGQVLVRLDDAEDRAAVEAAQSKARRTEADLMHREAQIAEEKRALKEQINLAQLRLEHASAKLTRARELLARGLLAGSALEDLKLAEEVARAELASLRSRDLSVYEKELDGLRQELASRQQEMEQARARMALRQIRAPVTGQVLRYEFVIGEMIRPDTVLAEIFGGEKQVLKLRIPERYAARVKVGQPYRANLASYSSIRPVWFRGQVRYVRDVIQGEGAKTYRSAFCDFNPDGRTVPPGTTAEAWILYDRTSFWAFLFNLP